MCMQNFIKIFQKFQEKGPVSLFSEFENLGKASINDKWHLTIAWAIYNIVNINVYAKFITIFHSVQVIGPFSHFQNLELGKASTDDKCRFAIPWARSGQYQCVCKLLSNYSKWFKS